MILALWILRFPGTLYHCFVSVTLLLSFIAYKINKACRSQGNHIYHRSSINAINLRQRLQGLDNGRIAEMWSKRNTFLIGGDSPRVITPAMVVVLSLMAISFVSCLEQDAKLLEPVASLAKSVINTVCLGVPLAIDFGPTELAKNMAGMVWRTGFPVTMPRTFLGRAQDFYNNIREQVNGTDISNLPRKRLVNLKIDLDNIVDAIVEQVRQSPNGLYTDYTQTMVGNKTLEEACFAVGLQMKAYGVDIANYRNIAGVILGVPVMPQLAKGVVNAGGYAKPVALTMTNFTSTAMQSPMDTPEAAISAISSLANSALGSLDFRWPPSLPREKLSPEPIVANA